jgi:signal transduction histidine kinase
MASPVAPPSSSGPSSAGPAALPAPLVGDRTGRTVEVLATVAHEFRNALTPLKGYLSILAKDGQRPGPAEDGEGVRVMLRQADRLERLASDLLAASTISSGRVPIVPESIDLASLVREQAETVGRTAGRTIVVRGASGPVHVVADPLRVSQVLANLLSNAIRYSPADQAVRVTIASSEARAIVSVRDEGPGIPVEDQERLFVPFARTASPGGGGGIARVDGTGLGLYVSRALVQAMSGRMWVVSRPDRGSTFSFSLPRADRTK